MAGRPPDRTPPHLLHLKLDDTNNALHEEEIQNNEHQKIIDELNKKIRQMETEYSKLQKHAKNCEKATGRAQTDAKKATGHADHLINSQKGQLKNAERRYEAAARDLKAWTDKYGPSVDKPADDKHALQLRVSEWQSKAEKARNEIAALEVQIQGNGEQPGLHQALEEWEEHQACGKDIMNLEDKVVELEDQLAKSKQRHQEVKSEKKALQIKADQLEKTNKATKGQDQTSEHLQRIQQLESDLEIKQMESDLEIQQLESDLEASKQQHQKLEEDIKTLPQKASQPEQANESLQDQAKPAVDKLHEEMLASDLKPLRDLHQQAESDNKALQEKADQLEQANKELRDHVKTDADRLHDEMLNSDLKTIRDLHQQAQSDNKALQTKTDELEQANKWLREQADRRYDMLQRLQSDAKASREKGRETHSNIKALQEQTAQLETNLRMTREECGRAKSDIETLQGKADQLETDLSMTRQQYETIKTEKETLQEKADQLERDIRTTKEQDEVTKSDMKTIQAKADQSESDLETIKKEYEETKSKMEALQAKADQSESDLETIQKEYEETKSNMEVLQAKADQLESDLETEKELHEITQANYELENKLLESDVAREKDCKEIIKGQKETLKEEVEMLEMSIKRYKDMVDEEDKRQRELANEIVKQHREAYPKQTLEQENLKEQERVAISQPLRMESSEEAKGSQVTPPLSPAYTTDEGSQDLEKTPRPKTSLRQDLGYSSQDHSGQESESDVFKSQQHDLEMSKQADTGEDKKEAAAGLAESSDSEDAEKHAKGSTYRGKLRHGFQRRPKNLETIEVQAKERAKEQSEVLETLFECTPAKANAIDRRLKALGPGCRLYEAPALVAYELSGIPEDTYKGLASGQLIATLPPNEVKDAGTDPEVFAGDVATNTADLPVEEVSYQPFIATDMATDTADLPVQTVPAITWSSRLWALLPYLLFSLAIILISYSLFNGLKAGSKFNTQNGPVLNTVYPGRHTPFPTPSLDSWTPITIVHPPTPAPQLGLLRMMGGGLSGGELEGKEW